MNPYPPYTEAYYLVENIKICERAAKTYQERQSNIIIKFECFNEQEAQWFENYMAKRFPNVKFYTTRLSFGDKKEKD